MKLQKLTLQGYKTFATKTEFEFDSGITAIVGPNGSGKSNIADALRWVLGEQSYSTLRAKRTADMIFAGSEQRARAGLALATITLDNSDGWLPIDYSEVEITRRAFRSGENEYLLNGQQVRLKDVAELLATSGLAERTYTIVGQGLIDQALSLRSDERRALFEEAAGINHYKHRRAETLRRLEETGRNLQRVHDILAELRPRVTSLKRQATRTQNYEQISEDLHALLRVWYGFRWERAKRDLREAHAGAQQAETAWQDGRRRLQAIQEQIDVLQRNIATAQGELADRQTAREQVRETLEKARRDHAILQQRRELLLRQQAELAQDLPALQGQQTAAQTDLTAATADLTAAQAQLATAEANWTTFRTAADGQQAEIKRWRDALTTAEAARREHQTRLAQAEGQAAQLAERLAEANTAEDEGSTLVADLAALDRQTAETDAALAELVAQVTEAREAEGAQQEQRRTQAAELNRLRQTAREQEQQLNRGRNELARLEERVANLERRRGQAIALKPNQVLGQLAGLVTIPAEYEAALAAGLGERLALWIVPEAADLWQAIDQPPGKNKSESSLLVAALADAARDALPPAGRPVVAGAAGVIGWANDLVTVRPAAAALVNRLLGAILVVADRQTAYELARNWPAGYVAVTTDGFVAHAGGLVEARGGGRENNILAREATWRQEAAKLETERAQLAEAEAALAGTQQSIQAAQQQLDTTEAAVREAGRAAADLTGRADQLQRRRDDAARQRGYLLRQQAAQTAAQAQVAERLEAMRRRMAEHQAALETAEADVAAATAQLAALPVGETEQHRATLQQALSTAQTIIAGRQAVVDSRRATLGQLDTQIGRVRARLEVLEQELSALAAQDDGVDLAPLQAEMDAHEAAIGPLRAQLETDRRALAHAQPTFSTQQKQAFEMETTLTQQRIRLAQQENTVENLQDRIRTDLGLVALSYDDDQRGAPPLPIEDVVEELPQVDVLPADIEETIQSYRGQLHRMGPVNPDAPAELVTTEERVEFLTQQIDDLTKTDAQLRHVIAELDELTSTAFAETVERVNGIFDQTFRQLFGGGSGRLVMTDPDDLTTSGVEIVARLPNRREQPLALLSGGERSLTAAALIFSLLKVAPPPFCVLDEVDAALDEANIGRFRDLLRELGDEIQFIVITHNRGTVQAASTIYGVSMQPDSASQVISIKPDEYLSR
jgi:chromosome segregation protein